MARFFPETRSICPGNCKRKIALCMVAHAQFLQRGRIACNAERCNTYINSVCLSVCPSVRPSHAGTLSRRMNIGLRGLHCEVAKTL